MAHPPRKHNHIDVEALLAAEETKPIPENLRMSAVYAKEKGKLGHALPNDINPHPDWKGIVSPESKKIPIGAFHAEGSLPDVLKAETGKKTLAEDDSVPIPTVEVLKHSAKHLSILDKSAHVNE